MLFLSNVAIFEEIRFLYLEDILSEKVGIISMIQYLSIQKYVTTKNLNVDAIVMIRSRKLWQQMMYAIVKLVIDTQKKMIICVQIRLGDWLHSEISFDLICV